MGVFSALSYTDWALLLLTVIGLIYLYLTWINNHWKKRGVPFVKPIPLFGNFWESTLQKKSYGDVYSELYNQLKGFSYGGFFRYLVPGVLICDPELLKQIMTKDFSYFSDNDIHITIEMDPMFGRNPFVLRGERWKTVRSQLTPAFTPGKLKPFFPLINDVCKDLKKYLEKEHPGDIEAKELASKFTTDVTATCIFGLNGNSFKDPNAEFKKMGESLMPSDALSQMKFACFFILPKVARFFRFRIFNDKVTNFFRKVTHDMMKYREENGVTRKDFLQLLMQLKAKGSVEDEAGGGKQEEFTNEDVTAHTLTFFSDGMETSAGALSFTLYELAVNPECQERLRAEVKAALLKHDGTLSYEMMQDVPYADMVLSESLRKYPPAPFLSRLCTRPYQLPTPDGGVYHVPEGTSIAMPIMGLHMDPNYYPDPERFDPERFSEEGKASRHQYTFMPFGLGPRGCLGSRFAQMQIKAALAAIVNNFDIQVCARTTVPCVLDPKAFLLTSKDGLWLKFVPCDSI